MASVKIGDVELIYSGVPKKAGGIAAKFVIGGVERASNLNHKHPVTELTLRFDHHLRDFCEFYAERINREYFDLGLTAQDEEDLAICRSGSPIPADVLKRAELLGARFSSMKVIAPDDVRVLIDSVNGPL